MKKKPYIVYFLVIVAVVSFYAYIKMQFDLGNSLNSPFGKIKIGGESVAHLITEMPDWDLETIGGEDFNSASLAGSPTIINFWTTWCTVCRAELPKLIALHDKYQDKGLKIVGINLDHEDTEEVSAYIETMGLNFPTLKGTTESIKAFGNIDGVPATFVINGEGEILKYYRGRLDELWIENAIKGLL